MEKAIFAAGCFWGVELTFSKLPGVKHTSAGYIGGHTDKPDYREVCTDTTGHAEAVEVDFDPKIISYEKLLRAFFEMHDPTTMNRQGPDAGSQYRSAIFYLNESQKEIAEKIKKEVAGNYKKPVVTEITKAGVYFPAEEYHQQYFKKRGIEISCH